MAARQEAASTRRAEQLQRRIDLASRSKTPTNTAKRSLINEALDMPPGVPVPRFDESRLLSPPTDEGYHTGSTTDSNSTIVGGQSPSTSSSSSSEKVIWQWVVLPEQELVHDSPPIKAKLENWTPKRGKMSDEQLAVELSRLLKSAEERYFCP